MRIITETKLSQLFADNARLGQGIFPELIKKLIIATANKPDYMRFPSGDAIFAKGFDGVITGIKEKNYNIPKGNSFWELGTNKKAERKLNEDFEKRSKETTKYSKKTYTFILCTSHIWSYRTSIENWTAEKKKQKVWKSVFIYDATVLADWLENHIEIAIWLLNEFGSNLSVNDISTLPLEYKRICELTNPQMSNEFLICNNDKIATELVNTLRSSKENYFYTVKSPINREHGYFFLIGAFNKENDNSINSKILIVNSQQALDSIKQFTRDKIIILNFECRDANIGNNNTYVSIATDDDIANANTELEHPRFESFAACLKSMGVKEEYKITQDLNRNISCFKRKFAVSKTIRKPQWADMDNMNEIIPIALISSFSSNCEGDKEILEKLSGKKYSEYIEILDKWLNVDDSPISKFNGIYKVNSKEEIIKVLGIDYQCAKLKECEEALKTIFQTADPHYTKAPSLWHIRDTTHKYSGLLLTGILDTFAILSNAPRANFYCLIKSLVDIASADEKILFSYLPYFSLMSEILATVILDYFENAVDNDDAIFIKVFETEYGIILPHSHALYVDSTLKDCLRREETCIQALRILLKIYYKNYNVANSSSVVRDCGTWLAPSSSGIVAASSKSKYELLISVSQNQDVEKTRKLIKKLKYGAIDYFISIPAPKWKPVDEEKFRPKYTTEMFEINALIYEWLIKHSEDKLNLFKDLIKDIRNNLPELNRRNFTVIENQLGSISEHEKKKLNHYLIHKIHDIKFYSNRDYEKEFLPELENLYNKSLSEDLFDRYSYIFENGGMRIPILDPTPYNNGNNLNTDDSKKLQLINKYITELHKKYGEELLPKMLEVIADGYSLFCGHIKELFKDYRNVAKQIILTKKYRLLSSFLYQLSYKEQVAIFESLMENERIEVVVYFPTSMEFINYIENTAYEKTYWAVQEMYTLNIKDETALNKIFDKMLNYNPLGLIRSLGYDYVGFSYEQKIAFLREISKSDNMIKIGGDLVWSINDFINKMDKDYYTEELVQLFFQFLAIFESQHGSYPMGIIRYIWENPEALAQIIDVAVKNIGQERTIWSSILYSYGMAKRVWIPKDYMLEDPKGLTEWANKLLDCKKNYDKQTAKHIDWAILEILAKCPEYKEQEIWPPQGVADIVEKIAGQKLEDRRNCASFFHCCKSNGRGMQPVGDGSQDLKLYEKYLAYSKKYEATHPTVSLALQYFADSHKSEAEMNKNRAIVGWGN